MNWSGPMTHRQFMMWEAWFSLEMNNPSRSDYYQMQTAFHVARQNAKDPNSFSINSMKLPFGDLSEPKPKKLNEQVLREARAASLERIGPGVRIRLPDGTFITKKQMINMGTSLQNGSKNLELSADGENPSSGE